MTWENSAITITTLLPIVGALVIAADAVGEGPADPRPSASCSRARRSCCSIAIAIGFDYGRRSARRLQFELDVSGSR